MKIITKETKEVEVTPELLAQIFWQMDNDEQGEFFDALHKIAGDKLSEQMNCVANFTDSLSMRALNAMIVIGKDASERLKEEA